MRKSVLFFLNGKPCEVSAEHSGMMLADYLRYQRGLTGTKIVCAEGDCGACTVLRYFPYGSEQILPVNSCISTVAQMDGSSLVTVDVIGEKKLSPVQNAMLKCHGSQCGFCTPGFIMAMTGLVEKKLEQKEKTITEKDAKNALTGNLCRCTGYQPIIDATVGVELTQCAPVRSQFLSAAQLRELRAVLSRPVLLETQDFSFYAPTTVKEAAKFLTKNPKTKILGAATDMGVVHNKRKVRIEKTLSLHLLKDLYKIKKTKAQVTVGARVTLAELRTSLEAVVPEFAKFLDLFASPQIKNVATLIGNVGNASPIADTPPFLLAMDAKVHIVGARGKRVMALDQFYLGHRKTALKSGELIEAISFSIPQKQERLGLYKASQRKDLDISAVNAAFRFTFSKKGRIEDVRLALGGVAATPLRLKKTEAVLGGMTMGPKTITTAIQSMQSEIQPLSDARGSAAFRRILAENFLKRFFREQGWPA